MLRKFLDSLYDPKTRLALEYFKEPKSIEEALEKAIAYEDAKGENQPKAKVRRIDTEEMSSEDILEMVLADAQGPENNEPNNTKIKDENNGTNEALKKLETQVTTLVKQNDEKQKRRRANPRKVHRGNIRQTRVPSTATDNEPICWNCSRVGHISRKCPVNPRQCHTCQRWGHIKRFCPSASGPERRSQNPFSANQSGGFQNRSQNNFLVNQPRLNETANQPQVPPLRGTGGQAATRQTTN